MPNPVNNNKLEYDLDYLSHAAYRISREYFDLKKNFIHNTEYGDNGIVLDERSLENVSNFISNLAGFETELSRINDLKKNQEIILSEQDENKLSIINSNYNRFLDDFKKDSVKFSLCLLANAEKSLENGSYTEANDFLENYLYKAKDEIVLVGDEKKSAIIAVQEANLVRSCFNKLTNVYNSKQKLAQEADKKVQDILVPGKNNKKLDFRQIKVAIVEHEDTLKAIKTTTNSGEYDKMIAAIGAVTGKEYRDLVQDRTAIDNALKSVNEYLTHASRKNFLTKIFSSTARDRRAEAESIRDLLIQFQENRNNSKIIEAMNESEKYHNEVINLSEIYDRLDEHNDKLTVRTGKLLAAYEKQKSSDLRDIGIQLEKNSTLMKEMDADGFEVIHTTSSSKLTQEGPSRPRPENRGNNIKSEHIQKSRTIG